MDHEDLPVVLEDEGPAGVDTEQMLLNAEQRRAYLSRLADFEVQLSALPEKRANFVLAMLQDPSNFSEAARKAGYAEKGAGAIARQLIGDPKIAACIATGEQLREDRTFVTSDRTMHEFAIIAFSDITNYRLVGGQLQVKPGVPAYMTRAVQAVEIDEHTWTDNEGNTHVRVKTKVKLWSKIDALKMIAMVQKILQGADAVPEGQQHFHLHQHLHNTWQIGDKKLTF